MQEYPPHLTVPSHLGSLPPIPPQFTVPHPTATNIINIIIHGRKIQPVPISIEELPKCIQKSGYPLVGESMSPFLLVQFSHGLLYCSNTYSPNGKKNPGMKEGNKLIQLVSLTTISPLVPFYSFQSLSISLPPYILSPHPILTSFPTHFPSPLHLPSLSPSPLHFPPPLSY